MIEVPEIKLVEINNTSDKIVKLSVKILSDDDSSKLNFYYNPSKEDKFLRGGYSASMFYLKKNDNKLDWGDYSYEIVPILIQEDRSKKTLTCSYCDTKNPVTYY